MNKRLGLVLGGLVLLGGGYFMGQTRSVVHAQTHAKIAKENGKCVGVYTRGEYVVLVFEDNAGTVRLLNASDGSMVGMDTRD